MQTPEKLSGSPNNGNYPQFTENYKHIFHPLKWLSEREKGCLSVSVHRQLTTNLYSNIKAVHTWEPKKSIQDSDHGGIFNFDFSPDG